MGNNRWLGARGRSSGGFRAEPVNARGSLRISTQTEAS
jgi:hypothetical protein